MSFEQKLFLTDLYAHLEVICPFPTLSLLTLMHVISVISFLSYDEMTVLKMKTIF